MEKFQRQLSPKYGTYTYTNVKEMQARMYTNRTRTQTLAYMYNVFFI